MTNVTMDKDQPLLVTRGRGRKVAATLPAAKSLTLDFRNVDVVSPSFLDELLKGMGARGVEYVVLRNLKARTHLDLLLSLDRPDGTYPHVTVRDEPF